LGRSARGAGEQAADLLAGFAPQTPSDIVNGASQRAHEPSNFDR